MQKILSDISPDRTKSRGVVTFKFFSLPFDSTIKPIKVETRQEEYKNLNWFVKPLILGTAF